MSCVVLLFWLPNKITPCGIKPNPQSMLICKKASLSLGSKSILVHHISSSNSEDLYCAGEWIKVCDAMVTSKPAAVMRDQRSLLGGRGRGEDRFLVAAKFSQTRAKQPICQVQFRAGPREGLPLVQFEKLHSCIKTLTLWSFYLDLKKAQMVVGI